MQTKIIEAVSTEGNHGKFMVGQMTDEWTRPSMVDGYPLLSGRGWGLRHLWVMDLQTGEGAIFWPGGRAAADLNKHRIWVCPLFEPFLEWFYEQDLSDLNTLPPGVFLEGVPLQLAGYRRQGPPDFMCACRISWGSRIPYGHSESACGLKVVAKDD